MQTVKERIVEAGKIVLLYEASYAFTTDSASDTRLYPPSSYAMLATLLAVCSSSSVFDFVSQL